jgi:pyruvate dehydrogenase (quinone)
MGPRSVGDPAGLATRWGRLSTPRTYAAYAESLGLRGIRIDRPNQIAPAWEAAFRADRPIVVEAVTDPDVPPLPPHITLKQAAALSSSLLKGDPNRRGVIRQTYRDMIESWKPHSG